MTPLDKNSPIEFTINTTGGGTDIYNFSDSVYPDPEQKARELELEKLTIIELIEWLQNRQPKGFGYVDEIYEAYRYELFSRFPFNYFERKIDTLTKENWNLRTQIKRLERKLKNHGHVGGEVMEKMK
jgi:hypothetical protein